MHQREDGKRGQCAKEGRREKPEQRDEQVLDILILQEASRVHNDRRDTAALAVGFVEDQTIRGDYAGVNLTVKKESYTGALDDADWPQGVEEESSEDKYMA